MKWAKMQNSQRFSGFTIVELLIVVVVIAILAAITIVSYNGITSRAKNSAQLTAVENSQKALMNAPIQGFTIADRGEAICLGNSTDYPAGDGFSAGQCAKVVVSGTTIYVTYNASDFSSWTTSPPSAKMSLTTVTTVISGDTYVYTARGAWLSYPYSLSNGGAAIINWVPQVPGECGSGANIVNAICQKTLTF